MSGNSAPTPLLLLRASRAYGRRASTLIELLTVIAMIGFLMGLLLPSLKRSMELAAKTACKANVRQVANGMLMYSDENEGWFPQVPEEGYSVQYGSGYNLPPSPGGDANVVPSPWFSFLFPKYMEDPTALRCPRDPFGFRVGEPHRRASDPDSADASSYGVSGFIMTGGRGYLANTQRHGPSRPQYTILLGDIGPDRESWSDDSSSRTRGGTPSRNGSMLPWSDGFDPYSAESGTTWLTKRHEDGIQMATLSGEVRDVNTANALRRPIQRYYADCAAAGCTLCKHLGLQHYSFAQQRLFWWTGPVPIR